MHPLSAWRDMPACLPAERLTASVRCIAAVHMRRSTEWVSDPQHYIWLDSNSTHACNSRQPFNYSQRFIVSVMATALWHATFASHGTRLSPHHVLPNIVCIQDWIVSLLLSRYIDRELQTQIATLKYGSKRATH